MCTRVGVDRSVIASATSAALYGGQYNRAACYVAEYAIGDGTRFVSSTVVPQTGLG